MKLWTIQEIVDVTGFSKSKVERAIKSGELESRKIKGSRRVSHEWLVAWLGFEPSNPDLILTISKTVKKPDRTVTKTTRVERRSQLKLFDVD